MNLFKFIFQIMKTKEGKNSWQRNQNSYHISMKNYMFIHKTCIAILSFLLQKGKIQIGLIIFVCKLFASSRILSF